MYLKNTLSVKSIVNFYVGGHYENSTRFFGYVCFAEETNNNVFFCGILNDKSKEYDI